MFKEFIDEQIGNWHYMRGTAGPSGFGSSSTALEVAKANEEHIKGKTFIVTGASSGIGIETARAIHQYGGLVIMACRNETKASKVAEDIIEQYESRNGKASDAVKSRLVVMTLDLGSFKSIREFVNNFRSRNLSLDVLINNAGVWTPNDREETSDGHEQMLGTNHYGHFLLTELLLPELKKNNSPTRVVNVASVMHRVAKNGIEFDDLEAKKEFSSIYRYGHSKLANLLHAKDLDQRMKEEGESITAVSLHPGVIMTGLYRDMKLPIIGPLLQLAFSKFFKNDEQGAATTIYCAAQPNLVGGNYHHDCNEAAPVTAVASDESQWKRLYEVSMEATGLASNE